MARIFLSYKREERDRVRAIVSALEAKGHEVWWDPHLDPRDASYQIQIKREIDAAQACVVAWSRLATESDFVVSEAEMARMQKKLVCVLLDHDCAPPPPFNTMQLIDLSDWHGEASHPQWRRALDTIDGDGSRRSVDRRTERPAKRTPGQWITGAIRTVVGLTTLAILATVVIAVGAAGYLSLRDWLQRSNAEASTQPVVLSEAYPRSLRGHQVVYLGQNRRFGVYGQTRFSSLFGSTRYVIWCPNGDAARPILRQGSWDPDEPAGACENGVSAFPTSWDFRPSADQAGFTQFARVVGRPLTGANPEADLRTGEKLFENRVNLTSGGEGYSNFYAVPANYRAPKVFLFPSFGAERTDTAQYSCEVSQRTRAFASTNELYFGADQSGWKQGQIVGSRTELLWVNFGRGEWATTTEGGTLPADTDGDGRIWTPIAGGQDQYVCLQYVMDGTRYGSGSAMHYSCTNYLNLISMERAYLSHGELRASYLNVHGMNPLVGAAMYRSDRQLLPGVATVGVGSCREIRA